MESGEEARLVPDAQLGQAGGQRAPLDGERIVVTPPLSRVGGKAAVAWRTMDAWSIRASERSRVPR